MKTIIKGIDVSEHNGTIDFKAVKKAGIDFVIIRAGYGNSETQIDKKYKTNMKNAKAAGLQVGVYWFSYARTATEAKKEADVCAKILNKEKLDIPVFFDWEDDSYRYAKENGVNITKAKVTGFCNAFMRQMKEKHSYKSGVYSNVNYLNLYIQHDKLNNCPLWVASWGSTKPQKYKNADFWQYTDSAHVSGVNGLVDMNIAYNLKKQEKIKSNNKLPYTPGKDYILQNEMAVRKGPGITHALVGYRNLTEDGKRHDRDCDGYLDTGTAVTCQHVVTCSNGDIWLKIPSGYVAAKFKGVTYIK